MQYTSLHVNIIFKSFVNLNGQLGHKYLFKKMTVASHAMTRIHMYLIQFYLR